MRTLVMLIAFALAAFGQRHKVEVDTEKPEGKLLKQCMDESFQRRAGSFTGRPSNIRGMFDPGLVQFLAVRDVRIRHLPHRCWAPAFAGERKSQPTFGVARSAI